MSGLQLAPPRPTTTVAAALSLFFALPLQARQGETVSRPKYSFLRQNEDWSAFARSVDLGATDDPLDRIKYVPLTDDGDVWLSIGGHARVRFENWNNFNFGLMPGLGHDDAFLLTRFLLHTDLHVGENSRLFVEGKTAQSTNRDLPGGTRPLDVDSLDLQQLFYDHRLELGDSELSLRVGRQMLLLGKQRLVSPLPWGNTLRTWDGVSCTWEEKEWDVRAFWANFVPVDIGDFNERDEGQDLFGAYATFRFDGGPEVDAYVLGLDKKTAAFNGTAGEETRYTTGARASDKVFGDRIDYEIEAAYQFGDIGPNDVSAWMLAALVGYAWEDAPTKPHLRVGLDMASGDQDAGGDVQTFNQLYPLGHAYLGYLDHVGRQNIIDTSVGLDFELAPRCKGRLDVHNFMLMSEDDALYNAGGGVIVPGGTSTSKYVGTEVNLTASYRFDRHLVVAGGIGRLFAGSVVDDAALVSGSGGEDIDFLFASVTYTF